MEEYHLITWTTTKFGVSNFNNDLIEINPQNWLLEKWKKGEKITLIHSQKVTGREYREMKQWQPK